MDTAMRPRKVLTISMPEYDLSRPLGYEQLGERIDRLVLASFPGGDYVDREIGSQDHSGKSVSEPVGLILEHGADLLGPLLHVILPGGLLRLRV